MYDRIDAIDVEGVVKYVKSLQNPDGSFTGDKWGEVDTRFSLCAVATLSLLVKLVHLTNNLIILYYFRIACKSLTSIKQSALLNPAKISMVDSDPDRYQRATRE